MPRPKKTAKVVDNRLHPALESVSIALGGDAYGLTASDYKLRNRIKNRLGKVRDRATLERVADVLGIPID